jgi:hypothetical protein
MREAIVVLKDDLDGSDAIESITFSVRGQAYEIDLNEKNAAAFDRALAKWVGAARKTRGGRSLRRTRSANDASTIRAWAAKNGIKISNRGRIPQDVIDRYTASR